MFRTIDQLALVKGIGLKTIERNRDRILLGNVRRRAPWRGGCRPAPRACRADRTPDPQGMTAGRHEACETG